MIHRSFVDTDLGQVHVRRRDGEGLPLLALHPSPASSAVYLALMERLTRPVVAPDRPGFGCSDPPRRAAEMDDYAAATLAVLDALGITVCDVVGTHTGSVEAVALAHLAPERVRRVALFSVPAYTESEIAERMTTRASPRPAPAEDGSHLLALWRKRFAARRPPYDLELIQRRVAEELTAHRPDLAYRAVFSYPMGDRLASLTCPVVVFSPHDDLRTQTERARELLPDGACFVDLPDLDVDLFDLAPERVAGLIESHLGDE